MSAFRLEPDKGSKATPAVYRDPELAEHAGNPLILALPRIPDPVTIRDWVGRFPAFEPANRDLPTYLRAHCLDTIPLLVVPVAEHLQLGLKLSRLLNRGYLLRNPVHPHAHAELCRTLTRFASGEVSPPPPSAGEAATGFAVVGTSGVGKTTCLDLLLSYYPQVITHTEFSGVSIPLTQLVWAKIQCPRDGSLKSLCHSFFLEVDRLTGTEYGKLFATNRSRLDDMIEGMVSVAATLRLGVLVIDEIQQLNSARVGGSEQIMNFFVRLVNEVGAPLILVGTPGVLPLLQRTLQQARRMSCMGDFQWNRMSKGSTWLTFLDHLWQYQYTRKPVDLSQELADAMYFESQGVADLAVKLFLLGQLRAMESGSESISKVMLKSVAQDELGLVRPLIKALRENNPRDIQKYGDLTWDVGPIISAALDRLGSSPNQLGSEAEITVPL